MGPAWICGLFLWALAGGCSGRARSPDDGTPESAGLDRTGTDGTRVQLLYAESPAVWFEGVRAPAIVSRDGRRALYGRGPDGGARVVDLESGRARPADAGADLAPVREATLGPGGTVALRGTRGGESGWFVSGPEAPRRLPLPRDAVPVWAPDGERVAWFRSGAPEEGVDVSGPGGRRSYAVEGRVTRLGWIPDASELLVMSVDPRGVSSLARVRVDSGDVETLFGDLDAAPYPSPVPIAVDAGGRRVFVALAGPGAPDPADRHRPDADRDLDVWELRLDTGARRAVVSTPADEFAPTIVEGRLYWTLSSVETSVVVVPREGGPAREVVEDAMLPTWRPDAGAMGITYGDWRAADWVLDWEGGLVPLDTAGRASGPRRPLVTGYHEDFSPVWSPDGRWIAYHSHRSPGPVVRSGGAGSTDDVYLRPAGSKQEIRLTEFGHEMGPPDWAPDGTRLVVTGWGRGSRAGRRGAWIVGVDPATGRPTGHRRLPLPDSVGDARNAAWSPGGGVIALAADVGERRQALWLVRPDGTPLHEVVEYPMTTYGDLDWTPDGESLVFPAVDGDRSQLFEVPGEGGEPRRLTDADANLLHPRVSPDGRWIAATRVLHRREIRRRPLP